MPRNLKRHRNQKGKTAMATQTAPTLTVVPSPGTQDQIKNIITAPRILADAIDRFKKNRTDAETELAQSLSKDLAAAPLNVDSAIGKYQAWKAKDDALRVKIEAAEKLLPIIYNLIEELEASQPDALKAVIQREIEQLQKEATAEKDKAALLKEQIDALKALLHELEKTGQATTAKRK
jgi:hypothetical protein